MQNILKKILRFGLKLLVPLTAQESYALIVSEGAKLIEGKYGSIMIREDKEFKRVYTTSPILSHSRIRQRAFSYKAYMQRKIFIVPASKTVKAHPELKILGIKYTIHIPLSYKNESIGVLIIYSKNEKTLGTADMSALKLFGSMASLAIRKTQLYDETKSALEARDHFISMAAHELRTPLTSVGGYIQLLYSKLAKSEGVEGRWIEQLYQESQRMEKLVNELLEINRIKEGKLNYFLRLCGLREILGNVKKIMRFSFPNREVILEDKLVGSDNIIGDQDKLLQIFINLVENGLRYSPLSSPVRIILNSRNSDFVILIKDEGVGIPKKEFNKIFEGYHQGSSHNKEGLGLGLFLVKNILIKLFGSIKVHSKVGKGTTMEVRLPKTQI